MRYFSFIVPWLRSRTCPGHDYDMLDIPADPEKTIQYVEFDYSCDFNLKAFVWLWADSAALDIHFLTECPCQWQLGRKVQNLTLIASIPLDPDCVKTTVVYAVPEGWTALAPNESYPLPTEPAEIGMVTFEAMTDANTTSQLTLLIEGKSFISDEINETPKTESWETGTSVSVLLVSLTNTGSSTVYIRNLTTA